MVTMTEQKTSNINSGGGVLNYWVKTASDAGLQGVASNVEEIKGAVVGVNSTIFTTPVNGLNAISLGLARIDDSISPKYTTAQASTSGVTITSDYVRVASIYGHSGYCMLGVNNANGLNVRLIIDGVSYTFPFTQLTSIVNNYGCIRIEFNTSLEVFLNQTSASSGYTATYYYWMQAH